MNEPKLIVNKESFIKNSGFTLQNISLLKEILLKGGLILLPSDTCYSLAALPVNLQTVKSLNIILNREDIPFSLAFPNFEKIMESMVLSEKLIYLFQKFTPGCLTVVCKAKDRVLADLTRSQDGTIGVRLTDSIIERIVAGLTDFPITTVPPKFNSLVIQDFDLAIKVVQDGIVKLGKEIPWAAIEAEKFYSMYSTVVGEGRDGGLLLFREGGISFSKIINTIENKIN